MLLDFRAHHDEVNPFQESTKLGCFTKAIHLLVWTGHSQQQQDRDSEESDAYVDIQAR